MVRQQIHKRENLLSRTSPTQEAPSLDTTWTPRSYSININARGQAALDAAGMLPRVQQASTPRKALVVHSVHGMQTVPKTAQILESRNRQARIDGDLALSRQTLCNVLQQSLLKEDKASGKCLGRQDLFCIWECRIGPRVKRDTGTWSLNSR